MEVTKWLKPSDKRVTIYGDSARVQAVTRVTLNPDRPALVVCRIALSGVETLNSGPFLEIRAGTPKLRSLA
jgi:hypothetical protein